LGFLDAAHGVHGEPFDATAGSGIGGKGGAVLGGRCTALAAE
jgi:hypothetical protein